MFDFAPYYTRQPNERVRQSQLEKWSDHIKSFCKSNNCCKLNAEIWQNSTLFGNPKINRRCHIEFIKEILKFMADKKVCISTSELSELPKKELLLETECLSGGYKQVVKHDQTYIVMSYSIAEVTESLLRLPPQLYTGFELRGDQYVDYDFQKCPLEILKMSLDELEKQKKLQIIKNPSFDETGIKIL
eukprot:NODE_328_length_9539_cov_0.346716.p6 type:complete len:188 gc:universal NODE_328_length_9539_cov_0.346716:2233-1670(-)